MTPLPVVGEEEGFVRLAMYQALLLAASGYLLFAGIFKERPRIL